MAETPKKKIPPKSTLKPSQQVVVSAFLDPDSPGFLNKTQAYKAAHPQAKDSTAGVEGFRTLENPRVRDAVIEGFKRLGFDKDDAIAELLWNAQETRSLKRFGDHREAVIAWAKITGNLIEKREVKTLADEDKDAIRRVVSESLRNPN